MASFTRVQTRGTPHLQKYGTNSCRHHQLSRWTVITQKQHSECFATYETRL